MEVRRLRRDHVPTTLQEPTCGRTLVAMELHLQVREARKQAGLTQQEIAERSGVARTDVVRFERGENVTLKTFLRIVGVIPDLRDLTIDAPLHLRKEGLTIPDEGQLMHRMAAALLQSPAGRNTAAAPPAPPSAADAPSSRDLSLLRTLALLIVELTGGAPS